MAVFISQEEPQSIRRTPPTGDGGVDILTARDDGWHVRQVKGFVGRMKPNYRKQVEHSFATVLDGPRLDAPIAAWSLTVPIDPTSGEQQWFEQMVADAPFPCNWEGEIYWHGMASKHPQVVDYQLRNGRARVEERSAILISAAEAASSPLTTLDVAGHLEALRASLNRDDPHYRYEFLTGSDSPETQSLPNGTVLSASRSMADGGFLTVFVLPRHRYSTEDSPIGGTLHIRVHDPDRGNRHR